jgi:hypothetical protein
VRATATHGWSLRTVGDFIGLQFGLVGFILLPVVLSALALTAWRGYRRFDPVAILLSTCVIVPLGYFFWKSLTLRVGDTWPMFLWPVGLPPPPSTSPCCRAKAFPATDDQIDGVAGPKSRRLPPASPSSWWYFSIMS